MIRAHSSRSSIFNVFSAFGFTAIALIALAGCKSGGNDSSSSSSSSDSAAADAAHASAPAPSPNAVHIKTFQFVPKELTVPVGSTVTWTNDDDIAHTVTSGTPESPSGTLNGTLDDKGKTYSATFPTAGDFPYFCDHHHSMVGVIHVK
jgi:plastocyanin